MTPRWPPILGVTGFDFGEKPAISLAVLPKKMKPNAEWETPITGEQVICECVPSNLATTYYVTSDAAPGVTATIESFDVSPSTCFDMSWNGQDEDGILIVGMDFNSPEPTQWQLGFDTPFVTLYKVAGSGPGGSCDISTPEGTYEGGGYTATVSLTP